MDLIKRGKRLIIAIIVIIVIPDVINMAIFPSLAEIPATTIRLLFEGLVLYALYRGHMWAKIITTIFLIGVGIICCIISVLNLESVVWFMALLLPGLTLISFAFLLLKSESIKTFLSYQREKTKVLIDPEISEHQKSTDIES